MRYLMLIKHAESVRSQAIPHALLEAMGPLFEDAMKRGVVTDTSGLKTTEHAIRIRSANHKLTVTDGPFTEAKEVVGGYVMINVDTDADARDFATQFVELHRVHFSEFEFEVEVRPLENQ